MSMQYDELLSRARVLSTEIARFLKDTEYDKYDDLSGVDYDHDDPNVRLMVSELRACAEKLDDAQHIMDYMCLPVTAESRLHKNSSGRYEMADGYYFCSGSPIEALIDEGDDTYWVVSRVESDGGDYYIVGYSKYPMEGMLVRRRGR